MIDNITISVFKIGIMHIDKFLFILFSYISEYSYILLSKFPGVGVIYVIVQIFINMCYKHTMWTAEHANLVWVWARRYVGSRLPELPASLLH